MTNKTQRVPVMPVPDLVRDDGSPMNAGSSTGIQSMVMPVCSGKSLNLEVHTFFLHLKYMISRIVKQNQTVYFAGESDEESD